MKIYNYKGQRNISGTRIREARDKMSLTQGELAARLQVEEVNLERDSISRIESGKRFVSDFELLVLSEILDVPIESLLGKKE